MSRSSMIVALCAGFLLATCAGPGRPSTPSPDPMPACHQAGTTQKDSVFFESRGENHEFVVHLPPCYADDNQASFPVLYWTNAYGQIVFDTADKLSGQGEVPPFIIVMVYINPAKGLGADEQIVDDVVPYIDAHYRTRADPLHRSITGISHGGAIAIRAAFRPPNLFGRVAVLSGGIADGEQAKFTNWIEAMPSDRRPSVLIDVGDQDGIMVLTQRLTTLLDQLDYPYTFKHAPGDHNEEFWDPRMEGYLKWLMAMP
jgi:enterochelin esterase-like enzyme